MKLLNEILGTRYPLIQGGMANIATGEFAAACSNAGALGLIGSGGMNADSLRDNIRRAKQLTDKPFGVNIMLMHPQADAFAKIVVEEGVRFVTTGAGNPGKYMESWKNAGITVMPVVAATVLAKHLVKCGADALIAEGPERWTCRSLRRAALPMAASWRQLLRWAPAARRSAPACWFPKNVPFTPTIKRHCSKQKTVTPSSPAVSAARRSGC